MMTNDTNTNNNKLVVSLLDYGAGNVRSVRNAISSCGYTLQDITDPSQISQAQVIIFPGVGSYLSAMEVLRTKGYDVALRTYLQQNRPYLGICLGMQTLFESSTEGGGGGCDTTTTTNNNNSTINDDEQPGGMVSSSSSSTSIPGLGIIPGKVIRFDDTCRSVPHIGWNGIIAHQTSPVMRYMRTTTTTTTTTTRNSNNNHTTMDERQGEETIMIHNLTNNNNEKEDVNTNEVVYFVHSYYAPITPDNASWILTRTTYEGQEYISSVQQGNVVATQFHPEKSGMVGLNFLKGFLESVEDGTLSQTSSLSSSSSSSLLPQVPMMNYNNWNKHTQLVKRVVVALDVRSNDLGDLVVTKGDQYDVREKEDENESGGRGGVRNLGKPVQLAARYYTEGADEIAFLNITSFRQGVIEDMPMLQVLEEASKCIFVPLTVGGGIRSYTDPESGRVYSALEVASRYFRAGADKVSIGSDAVYAAEDYIQSGGKKTGETSIETISHVYGVQAVVISIDPKRVYLSSPPEEEEGSSNSSIVDTKRKHVVIALDDSQAGPNGERYCWYQCTVKGGREARDICAVSVAKAVEALGAGEIMLNCIDMDGQCNGFDHALMKAVSSAVSIPVIASSGAGNESHFVNVFKETNVQAALAAGMFHRKEVEIGSVKKHMEENGIPARMLS